MTATGTISARGAFDIGRVIQTTFAAVRANLPVFTGLSAILSGVPAGLFSWLMFSLVHSLRVTIRHGAPAVPKFDLSALPHFLGGGGLAWFVTLLAGLVLQASIIYGTVAYLNGRPAGFGECLGAALRRLPLLALLGLIMFVAEVFGAMLFLFPAIMMAMAWFVAVPVLVTERTGVFEALGRSGALTRGHRWAIFGLAIIYFFVYLVVQQVFGAVVRAFTVVPTLGALVSGPLITSVLLAIVGQIVSMTGVACVYYELRSIKEGVGPEALAAVFD